MNLDQLPLAHPDLAAATDGRIALDAALLKGLRKTRGLSQEALAELCAARHLPVSIASIKRAETGKVVLYRTARHLATIFEIDLDAMVAGADDEAAEDAPNAPVSVPAQPPAPASAPVSPPTLMTASASVRYVVELHIVLDARPGAEAGAALAQVAGRFGATLEHADSAAPVALFGLPQAFRSDAERSLRCAIELRKALLVHGGLALSIRLARWRNGVADEPAALPATPAARAGDAPLAMPIQVARGLLGQLGGRFEFGASVDGYAAFTGERAGESHQALSGRIAETRQFQALADATRESQACQLVYLRAMAGVGKTRLAREFSEQARAQGFSCHHCHVQDAGADSWRTPLGELARSLFDAGDAGDGALEAAIDGAADALALDLDAAIFYRAVSGARMTSEQMSLYAAMSHEVRERGLAGALAALVLARAAHEPLLLLVEDVHWGDPYLFEALGALINATREAPVLWVLSSRIEHDPLDAFLRPHLFELPLTLFDLAPLNQRDALGLATQYGDVDPAYRARCVERAQGNPLFLTQLLSSPEHQLPDSLKHLVQARVDALPAQQQRALRTAAVIGNRFELGMLREALGAPDYELDVAGRHALVRRVGADAGVFVHDLVMHCIYESIDAAELRRLHRTVATLYRERDPALSAQHLYRADDPAAFDMMLRAIRDKLASYEYAAALELTDECSANDSTRFSSFTLALLKARAIAGLGQMVQARDAYQHALMLAGRPQEKIDAVIGLATTLNILEQLDEEERLLDETLPLARSINADAALGKLLYLKGNIYFPRGNYAECRRHHDEAVRHAQASGTSEIEARALSGLGDSYYAQGHMGRACELFSQCISMCEEHGYVGIEASNRSALGSTRLYLGQPQAALADARHSAQLAHKVGNRRAEVFARMTAGWVLVATGALDEAEEDIARALALARTIGAARFETFLMESQARVSWQRGEHALAERQIMAVAATVERLQLQRFIGPWVLGSVALFTSDAAVRKRALLQGAAYLTGDCLAHNAFRFYVSAAEVALLERDLVTADFYAGQLAGYASAAPCAWVDHHTALIRVCAALYEAPTAQARADLDSLRAAAHGAGFAHATPRLGEIIERF